MQCSAILSILYTKKGWEARCITLTSHERLGVSTDECTVCSIVCLNSQQRENQRSALLAPCKENPPVMGGFPPQRVSDLECVSIAGMWCKHCGFTCFQKKKILSALSYCQDQLLSATALIWEQFQAIRLQLLLAQMDDESYLSWHNIVNAGVLGKIMSHDCAWPAALFLTEYNGATS